MEESFCSFSGILHQVQLNTISFNDSHNEKEVCSNSSYDCSVLMESRHTFQKGASCNRTTIIFHESNVSE